MFFKDCIECEFFVIGMMFVMLVAVGVIDYIRCKKRRWGCNPPKLWKK